MWLSILTDTKSGVFVVKQSTVRKLLLLTVLSCLLTGSSFYLAHYFFQQHSAAQQQLKQQEEVIQKLTKERDALSQLRQQREQLLTNVTHVIEENSHLSASRAQALARLEIQYSKKYHIPLAVGLAISSVESNFNTNAVSYNGSSFGIKQVNYHAWQSKYQISKERLFNPALNMDLGYYILAKNLQTSHSLKRAIQLYLYSAPSDNVAYMDKVLGKATRIRTQLAQGLV